jgi:signal transduction histidine kinase
LSIPHSVFKYQSGRVIALGRVILATLFLLSIWLDQSQPANAPAETYILLLVYVLFAGVVAAATWRNWWIDARLAGPTHVVDMAMFTAIVFSTNGYTSPFFLFFILPLLSAAIRWGWRETALTATALVILYLAAGLLVTESEQFELQRFMVRSGHLMILSALLIWFGIHQRITRLVFRIDDSEAGLGRDDDPLAQALALVMEGAQARSGALLLPSPAATGYKGLSLTAAGARGISFDEPLVARPGPQCLLFDLGKDRCLSSRSHGWFRFSSATRQLATDQFRRLCAGAGLVCDVHAGTERGWLVLWDIADPSVDFLDLGVELGRAAGAVLDRDALLAAMEQGTAVRTRLALARDVHDSLVQFLAGATFRVEAIIRNAKSSGPVDPDLEELKRLLIEEQAEIRLFVSALRRDRELEFAEAADELKALARRLARQWSVACRVRSTGDEASIPIRVQLDLQHLLREAVANAVRHGGADRVEVELGIDDDLLRLEISDNGSGFLPSGDPDQVQPWSLKERVDRAHGSLSLFSEPGATNLLITLPLTGATA